MPRIRIDLPATFPFAIELPVRITDVNYGGHLGNDALLSLLHEARCRFLLHHGCSEANTAGVGMVMVDAALTYRQQAFHGAVLKIEVGVTDFQRTGCDFVYRVTHVGTGALVAEAKTGIVFFDYATRKIQRMPAKFAVLNPDPDAG